MNKIVLKEKDRLKLEEMSDDNEIVEYIGKIAAHNKELSSDQTFSILYAIASSYYLLDKTLAEDKEMDDQLFATHLSLSQAFAVQDLLYYLGVVNTEEIPQA